MKFSSRVRQKKTIRLLFDKKNPRIMSTHLDASSDSWPMIYLTWRNSTNVSIGFLLAMKRLSELAMMYVLFLSFTNHIISFNLSIFIFYSIYRQPIHYFNIFLLLSFRNLSFQQLVSGGAFTVSDSTLLLSFARIDIDDFILMSIQKSSLFHENVGKNNETRKAIHIHYSCMGLEPKFISGGVPHEFSEQ